MMAVVHNTKIRAISVKKYFSQTCFIHGVFIFLKRSIFHFGLTPEKLITVVEGTSKSNNNKKTAVKIKLSVKRIGMSYFCFCQLCAAEKGKMSIQ
jgi:hypothetical protein